MEKGGVKISKKLPTSLMDVPILWFFSDAELFLKLLNQRKTFSFFLFYKPAGVLNAHSPISELSLLVKLFSLEHSGPQM